MPPVRSRGVSRRAFVKSAVAIGGAAALAACQSREGPDLPTGTDDPTSLPARQHAWNEVLSRDDHGNVVQPRHRVLLLLDYAGTGVPSAADRETVEAALAGLERAYPRSNEGLLVTASYSPAYFDRFDEPLPDGVDLPEPEPLAPFEDPTFDAPDAVVHLASDYGSVVLGAEEALRGNRETLNGVDVTGFEDVLTVADRRSGFVGEGLPADHQDVDGVPDGDHVPEDAPLYMGFKSGFEKNQASEDFVTIDEGPFADGTTQHLSLLRLHLDQWYEQDSRYHRVATMFCPAHAEAGAVEGIGDNLGDTSQTTERGCPAHTADDAHEHGVVGHSQKSARARTAEDSPLILRRDFDSTDDDRATLHFLALQESIADFVETREAMNGTDLAAETPVGQRQNNGILQYMSVERRGNYLVPPRRHRALPRPNPEGAA
ncbi:MAG: Tat pathway signal protein [Haloarculaceae archaeon]